MATPDLTLVSESTLPAHLDATLTSAKGYADTKKNEAIADATTKYGSLPTRVTQLETDKLFRGHNAVTDLNNATESGLYTFGTLPANAPSTANGSAFNEVSGTTIVQSWTTQESKPRVFRRRRVSGSWSPFTDDSELAMQGRGILPSGTNLKTLNKPIHHGDYALTQDLWGTYVGLPAGAPTGVRGTLRVNAPNDWTVTHELHINTGTVYWVQTMLSPDGPTFNPWQKIDTSLIVPPTAITNLNNRGILDAATDLNTLCLPAHHGDYALSGPNWASYLNLPPGITETTRATLEVLSPNNWTVTHRVTPSVGTKHYERVMTSPTGPVFGPWKVIDSAKIPTANWVHWGDSLTSDQALGTDAWVAKLAQLTGQDHINEGWYGHLAAQIAARQGGNPALMSVEGGTIPASGTQVRVLAETMHVSMPVGEQQPTRQVPGTLAGRTGYLVDGGLDVNDGYFMPTDGKPESAAAGVFRFIPTGQADTGRNRIMTICIGENDIWSAGPSPQHVAYMARQMIDYQSTSTKRVLVLGIPRRSGNGAGTATGQKTQAINDALKAELPSAFVDLAGYMMSDQAATDAGVTYSADDLADIAEGVTPRVFRLPGDSVHYNALGCSIIAPFVYAAARDRGWVS